MKIFFLLALICLPISYTIGQTIQKNRVIILTDIEADPDDTQSLVRLLLYSNQIDIEGIIATTSCWMTSSIHPESIERVIDAYAEVQPNLLKHEAGFPEAKALSTLVKSGLPKYGMEGVGDGMDSEGSEWIIKTLEKNDDRPLWISTWGGVNTLAQALYKIDKTKSKEESARLISKLRVYTISDQDDSGIWIRTIFQAYFTSSHQEMTMAVLHGQESIVLFKALTTPLLAIVGSQIIFNRIMVLWVKFTRM